VPQEVASIPLYIFSVSSQLTNKYSSQKEEEEKAKEEEDSNDSERTIRPASGYYRTTISQQPVPYR